MFTVFSVFNKKKRDRSRDPTFLSLLRHINPDTARNHVYCLVNTLGPLEIHLRFLTDYTEHLPCEIPFPSGEAPGAFHKLPQSLGVRLTECAAYSLLTACHHVDVLLPGVRRPARVSVPGREEGRPDKPFKRGVEFLRER